MGFPSRRRTHEILERARDDDRASRVFDLSLIALIVASIAVTILESVPSIEADHGVALAAFELLCVGVFSVEYVLRVVTIVDGPDPRYHDPLRGRLRYMVSPLALADLLAVAPFYLSGFVPVDLRMLRVLRLIRIFKLSHYFSALSVLMDVIRMERHAFGAAYFLVVVGLMVAASGIHLFEHAAQPEAFGSIPAALWWSVSTLTTVGYGDVTPVTLGGRIFGTVVMMLGVGTVAVPTGILATGFALELRRRRGRYSQQLDLARADGVVDEDERRHLERLRRSLALSEEEIADLEEEILASGPPLPAPPLRCPHCEEWIGEPRKPLPPAAGDDLSE